MKLPLRALSCATISLNCFLDDIQSDIHGLTHRHSKVCFGWPVEDDMDEDVWTLTGPQERRCARDRDVLKSLR